MTNPLHSGDAQRATISIEDDSHDRQETETAVSQFQDAYSNLSPLQRQDLMKVTLRFSSNQYFRRYAMSYFEPYATAPKPFRFMDLPTELRLRIAEYTLAEDRPFYWAWNMWSLPGSRWGRFSPRVEKTVGLCRVSRQLHKELSPLFFKVNTFRFEGTLVQDCVLAYQTMARSLPTHQLRGLNISFVVSYDHSPGGIRDLYREINQIAALKELAPTHLKVEFCKWTLDDEVIKFLSWGRAIVEQLAGIDLCAADRNWRFFPLDIGSWKKDLWFWLEILPQEAVNWIESGI